MDYDIFREELAIKYPSYGHALWDPSPGGRYTSVEIGDVGFIREGYFHRLFNTLLPEDHPSHRDGVPPHHEPLVLRMTSPINTGTLQPNNFRSNAVSDTSDIQRLHASGPDEAAQFSFSCSRRQGGVLSLPVPAQRQDTAARAAFAKCIVKHIDEWFAFAREYDLGINREDIILVTGRHLARSWANIAFHNGDEQVSFGVQVSGCSGVNWQFTPEGARGVIFNLGPSGQNLPEDQCLFVRGFRVIRFAKIFPWLRGAATPARSPRDDDPDTDTDVQLMSMSTETRDPLHTLMDYIATQAPDCDMALVHDDDLLCLENASIKSLQPDTLMNYLRKSSPEIYQIQGEFSLASQGGNKGSNAEAPAPPIATVTKVATLYKYTFETLADNITSGSSSDDGRYTALSLTTPIPKEVHHLVSMISSFLYKWIPAERHYIKLIVIVVCLETAFLKWIRRSNEDVLSILFFSFLLGSFAWPAWINLKRQLDDLSGRTELLQLSMKSLESTLVRVPLTECIPASAVPNVPLLSTTEDHLQMGTSKSIVKPVVKPVDPEQTRPVQPPVVADEPLYPPYDIPATLEHVERPVVIENLPPSVLPAAPWPDSGSGVEIQGLTDNISDIDTAGSSAEQHRSKSRVQPAPPPKSAVSHWLPFLHEIKQRKPEKMSHLSRNVTSNLLALRRCGVRLLMSAASLSTADFASPVGYLGSSESTPYYPTGDLQDRNIAFTNAMDCVDHLEDYLHGNDEVRIATKFFELAQALGDLGLHEYAFNTSGFALDTLQRLYTAAPDDSRLHLASTLSLRANILYDLKRNDEAIDMADRAVSLCKEHRDSQTSPVPELAYALLNYAVLLNSIGRKDESAVVALELLSDADETQSDMKDISALCNLCFSNTRIGTDDDKALSMAEEAIELTRTSSDASPQTVLAGALLNKSKILSSRGQNDAAVSLSAEAVTLLRCMSAFCPVFSLFLAHALDVHARTLFEANRKVESYGVVQNAVELWQTLKVSAPGPIARPLAWALFNLAKFRHRGGKRDVLREELRIAESAVNVFREVVPLDAPGLAEALFLYADRMLELDKNREAANYAEESVQYFREALDKDEKYALDLIFSLSLASSCLASTERGDDAFEYAKEAVEVQHRRKNAEDTQYEPHLRQLLMDVVFRATDNDKPTEASPWVHELQSLDSSGEESIGPLARRSGNSQRQGEEIMKETSYWMDANAGVQSSNNGSASAPVASSSTLSIDKGKGKEVAPSAEVGSSTSRMDKRKVNIKIVFDPSTEDIFGPGATVVSVEHEPAGGLGNAGPLMGNNILGAGAGGKDLLSDFLGLGGGGMDGGSGGIGMNGVAGSGRHPGGGRSNDVESWGGMGGFHSLGGSINGLTENVLGNLPKLGTDRQGQGQG